jgi:DNA polymerase III subunit epsilon
MGLINKDTFICLDCETTGLDPENDRIIEVAAVKFTFEQTIGTYESLIDPEIPITEVSQEIHHISNEMVKGKPKIQEVLPDLIKFIGRGIIVGHGIKLDVSFVEAAAKRHNIPCALSSYPSIDTLRMARLYGESPINSLEKLREHFNIAAEGAHRAMNDVVVNIEVFKFLSNNFKTTEQLLERLKRPILLKKMPLGKHKGRPFGEIPIEYLLWAANKDFDQDLLFSLRSELKKRKTGTQFRQASNPFSEL